MRRLPNTTTNEVHCTEAAANAQEDLHGEIVTHNVEYRYVRSRNAPASSVLVAPRPAWGGAVEYVFRLINRAGASTWNAQ